MERGSLYNKISPRKVRKVIAKSTGARAHSDRPLKILCLRSQIQGRGSSERCAPPRMVTSSAEARGLEVQTLWRFTQRFYAGHSRTYRCLFFRFLRDSIFGRFSLGVSPMSSKGLFVPEVGVLAELVHASWRGGGVGCGCVPGITSLGSDNIAR